MHGTGNGGMCFPFCSLSSKCRCLCGAAGRAATDSAFSCETAGGGMLSSSSVWNRCGLYRQMIQLKLVPKPTLEISAGCQGEQTSNSINGPGLCCAVLLARVCLPPALHRVLAALVPSKGVWGANSVLAPGGSLAIRRSDLLGGLLRCLRFIMIIASFPMALSISGPGRGPPQGSGLLLRANAGHVVLEPPQTGASPPSALTASHAG